MRPEPLVSIVILNWNGQPFLRTCLDSVFKLNYPRYEVIFVDNGSVDDSVPWVRANYPQVKVIENESNLGYAEGNNIGIRASRGEYVATLNNDTELDPDWLEELVAVATNDDTVGSCASKQLLFHKPDVLHSVGIQPRKSGAPENLGDGERDLGQYDMVREVFAAPGASAFYRREALDHVGLFDSSYFAYHEELDLGWRLRLAGWVCVSVPRAKLLHIRSGTVRRIPDFTLYHSERNRIWTLLKNASLTTLAIFMPAIKAYEIRVMSRDMARSIVKQKGSVALRARIDALKQLSPILEKRKKVQALRQVSESSIREWFK